MWLELLVTQGSRFTTADEHEVNGIITSSLDIGEQRIYCTAEENQSWCYIRFDEARIPITRLTFYESELRQAFHKEVSRSLDQVNVVDAMEVAEHVPEAVR